MYAESGPVILTSGPCPHCGTSHATAHHRHYPEVAGLGETPRAATEALIQALTREADRTSDPWHRGAVERAIADARTALEQRADGSA